MLKGVFLSFFPFDAQIPSWAQASIALLRRSVGSAKGAGKSSNGSGDREGDALVRPHGAVPCYAVGLRRAVGPSRCVARCDWWQCSREYPKTVAKAV